MTLPESGRQGDSEPQDLVAIFHASFHPTRGNVIDWFVKASDDLSLDNLEFSALPSGLHLVEQDVVYFSRDGHQGVCAFRRVKSSEEGHRGFRLSSLGVLLAKSARPKPWKHAGALKDLITMLYARMELAESLQPSESDWEPMRNYFEEHKVRRPDLGGAGDWAGWSHELDGADPERSRSSPTLHLPHLLRILGPSSLTLYKHVIGRKRILIYTLPPVEAACILCQVAADLCYEQQEQANIPSTSSAPGLRRLQGKCREGINVLGMITLSDVDRLKQESQTGRGWIACTTDAIFLEKPSYYDLLIDLTTSTPNKATRPTFYSSRPVAASQASTSRGPTHRLSTIRFAWSDVKMWNELDRILQLDTYNNHSHSTDFPCCSPSTPPGYVSDQKGKFITAWTDVWRVYEDVCLVCAGLWMGSWRGNSKMSYSSANGSRNWGSVRLEGDDDLTVGGVLGEEDESQAGQMRNLGMGIEGRPVASQGQSSGGTSKGMRRTSGMSWSTGKGRKMSTTTESTLDTAGAGAGTADVDIVMLEAREREERRRRDDGQLLTTLALLQTFHAHTAFQLSTLESFLPPLAERLDSVVYLTPKDVLMFELGPFSGVDERYLEWLGGEYGGGARILVKRGWKDIFGIVFGYG